MYGFNFEWMGEVHVDTGVLLLLLLGACFLVSSSLYYVLGLGWVGDAHSQQVERAGEKNARKNLAGSSQKRTADRNDRIPLATCGPTKDEGTQEVNFPCNCHNPIFETILNLVKGESCHEALGTNRGCLVEDQRVGEIGLNDAKCTIFRGGSIYPCEDDDFDRVEAIAIVGQTVLCHGDYEEVLAAAKESGLQMSEIELAEEQALLPGFIDPHVHIVLSSMLYEFHDFGPFVGQELRGEYSRSFVRERLLMVLKDRTPGHHWILGKLLDPSLMPFSTKDSKTSLNKLTRLDTDFFDSITSEVPVIILSASVHTAYVNTPVLSALFSKFEDIRKRFKDLNAYRSYVNARGGLQEMSEIVLAIECVPLGQLAPMVAKLNSNLDRFFKSAFAVGITTLYDAGMTAAQKVALEEYRVLLGRSPRLGSPRLSAPAKKQRLCTRQNL